MDFDAYDFRAASGSWIAKDFVHGRPRAPKRQLLARDGHDTVIGLYYNDPHPYATLQRELGPGDPCFMEIPAEFAPLQTDPESPAGYLPHRQSPPARP